MIKVLDIGGLDVKTAGLLFNPANEIHSNIFHFCPLLRVKDSGSGLEI
jgi:hypothetical protein